MNNAIYCNQLEGNAVTMISGLCANITHLVLTITLVGFFNMQFEGVCIATGMSLIARFFGSLYFMRVTKNDKIREQNSEPFFSKLTIMHLGYQAKICMHQMMMGVWPLWGLEVFTMMAGYISTTALAAQSILRSTALLVFMFPFGLRMATQVFIGKNVGAHNAAGCRETYKAGLILVAVYAFSMTSLMRIFEDWFMSIFTND
jgi:Na+-driven multidrug efflux pump